MQKVGPQLKAALEKIMREENCDLFIACLRPEARIADQRDKKAAEKSDLNRTTAEWLAGLNVAKGFQTQDDMLAAMADPMYKSSEEYRQAVRALVANTPEQICGVQRPLHNLPTNDQMLQGARQEMFNQRKADLMARAGRGDAAARVELLTIATDPAYADMLETYDRSYEESHPMEMALKAAKARGERVGTNTLSGEMNDASEGQHAAIAAHPINTNTQGGSVGGSDGQGAGEWV